MNIIVAILLGLSLSGLFIFTYYINKRMPIPKGYEPDHGNCHGCTIKSCSVKGG